MAYINDSALDAGLNWIKTNGTSLHICSAEPTTYAEAATTYELAVAAVTLTGPAAGDTSGRKVTIPQVSDDAVDTTGTATHWALTNGSDTLVATGSLAASYSLDSAGTYTFNATDIESLDFASE